MTLRESLKNISDYLLKIKRAFSRPRLETGRSRETKSSWELQGILGLAAFVLVFLGPGEKGFPAPQ